MFRIGEFSQLVRVSPRMLRHYEKCGLFCPAATDPFTGYRQYSAGQISLLGKITALREMGFSIEEVASMLPHLENNAMIREFLRAKIDEVKQTIDTEQAKLLRLAQMSDALQKERKTMDYKVELKKLSPVKVLALRGIIPHYRDEGMLWEKLGRYIDEHNVHCHSDGYSIYCNEEYKEENPEVEIAIPVDTLGKSEGEFVYKELPGIELAATLRFSGPFDGGYDTASEQLATWMEENGYEFAGHLRGHVLTSPDDQPDPEKWLTELQAPVAKK